MKNYTVPEMELLDVLNKIPVVTLADLYEDQIDGLVIEDGHITDVKEN